MNSGLKCCAYKDGVSYDIFGEDPKMCGSTNDTKSVRLMHGKTILKVPIPLCVECREKFKHIIADVEASQVVTFCDGPD